VGGRWGGEVEEGDEEYFGEVGEIDTRRGSEGDTMKLGRRSPHKLLIYAVKVPTTISQLMTVWTALAPGEFA
jgi:hypothetical protein